jgi:trimeric autotransporter adhesin
MQLNAFGANFASTAVLNFNGVTRPTTVWDTQDLSAILSSADLANAGTVQITVSNPTPGGGPSSPQTFTIAQPTVVPTIASVLPSSAPTGTFAHVTITGTGFIPGLRYG